MRHACEWCIFHSRLHEMHHLMEKYEVRSSFVLYSFAFIYLFNCSDFSDGFQSVFRSCKFIDWECIIAFVGMELQEIAFLLYFWRCVGRVWKFIWVLSFDMSLRALVAVIFWLPSVIHDWSFKIVRNNSAISTST